MSRLMWFSPCNDRLSSCFNLTLGQLPLYTWSGEPTCMLRCSARTRALMSWHSAGANMTDTLCLVLHGWREPLCTGCLCSVSQSKCLGFLLHSMRCCKISAVDKHRSWKCLGVTGDLKFRYREQWAKEAMADVIQGEKREREISIWEHLQCTERR